MNPPSVPLDISAEVRTALDESRPVVALESTLIAHGMPWPQNHRTAIRLQQAVRDHGATPATVALMQGRLKVGLSDEQLETLARAGVQAIKCSRRDIPFLLHNKSLGATTVAATMMISAWAGISVFATGGIGGVHRGAESSMDISADLQELAQTNLAVVCAGPKAILDIGLTREYLETHGVPVIGFQTDQLPAFYSHDSGFGVDYRLDSVDDIAAVMRLRDSLQLKGGIVVVNPPPAHVALDSIYMEQVIADALTAADKQGVNGKELTPFLLASVAQKTAGESLQTNIELVLNNARLGAQIAASLCAQSAGSIPP